MATALETRAFGSTRERVTVLGLGGAPLDKESFNDGVATVRRALELGVTYFDTSPFYGRGMSQAIYGTALEGRSEGFLLATKLGHMATPLRHRSVDALRSQLEENLRILRRDHVDVLQVHESDMHNWWSDDTSHTGLIDADREYDFGDAPVMEVLREAKEKGICRSIGITGNDATAVARVFRELKFRFEQLYGLQQECGLSLVKLTIRYLVSTPNISTILVGAGTPAELEESVVAAWEGPLPPDLHQAIEGLGLP